MNNWSAIKRVWSCAAVLVVMLGVSSCVQTHWLHPPGKTMADWDKANKECQVIGFLIGIQMQINCLKDKGYRQITKTERDMMFRIKFFVPPGKTETDLLRARWECSATMVLITEAGLSDCLNRKGYKPFSGAK